MATNNLLLKRQIADWQLPSFKKQVIELLYGSFL